MAMIILKCEICGNVAELISEKNGPVNCCNQDMKELIPGTSDGAKEKHVPVVTITGNKVVVKVGEADHPMMDNHFIEWIAIETNRGVHRIALKPSYKPCAEFILTDKEKVVAAYAYCNLHGLWKC